jgi:FkbM family methyltransferase
MDKSIIIERTTSEGSIAYYKNDAWILDEVNKSGRIFEADLVFSKLFDIIKNSYVVIDGGAHAGSHTILYKHINPSLEVHCFEPQAKMFELLKYNVKENKLSNVRLYSLALANKEALVSMGTTVTEIGDVVFDNLSYGGDHDFNLGGLGFGVGGEDVKTTLIDNLNLSKCDFIKLDLEGSEALALLGAVKTIEKFKPTILFEHNHHQIDDSYYDLFQVERITPFEILESLGYLIEDVGLSNYLARWVGQ